MNKQKFNQIVAARSVISDKDLVELVELSGDYPYCQPIHSLIAKSSREKKIGNANAKLTRAALYVADRKVLRQLMDGQSIKLEKSASSRPTASKKPTAKTDKTAAKSTAGKKAVPEEKTSKKPVEKTTVKSKPVPESTSKAKDTLSKETDRTSQPSQKLRTNKPKDQKTPAKPKTRTPARTPEKSRQVKGQTPKVPISEIVLKSLDELEHTKEEFFRHWGDDADKAYKDRKKKSIPKSKGVKSSKPKKEGAGSKSRTSKSAKKPESAEIKEVKATPSEVVKETVAESNSNVTGESKPKSKTGAGNKKKKSSKTKTGKKKAKSEREEVPTNKYLKDIKKTHKKQSGKGSRLKEQIDLINRFIEDEPKIGKPEKINQEDEEEIHDLADESVEFHENLVSENLARIFTRQKQYDKAIEIYKKLIWKFPQKKSYFAAQIEEIKQK